MKISREENVKQYFIFSDKRMMDVLEKMPKSKEELKNVNGFGDIKVNKYGEGIIDIIS